MTINIYIFLLFVHITTKNSKENSSAVFFFHENLQGKLTSKIILFFFLYNEKMPTFRKIYYIQKLLCIEYKYDEKNRHWNSI